MAYFAHCFDAMFDYFAFSCDTLDAAAAIFEIAPFHAQFADYAAVAEAFAA